MSPLNMHHFSGLCAALTITLFVLVRPCEYAAAQVGGDEHAVFERILNDSRLRAFRRDSPPRFMVVTFGATVQANVIRVDMDGTATEFWFTDPDAIKGTTRLCKTWKTATELLVPQPNASLESADVPISQRLVMFDYSKPLVEHQLFDRRHLPNSIRALLRSLQPSSPGSFGKTVSRIGPSSQVLLNRNISLQRSSHFGCSPDGHYYLLYQGGDDVEVIDAVTGMTAARLVPSAGRQVHECRFSHEGKFLAVRVNGLPRISVFEVGTWKLIAEPQNANGVPESIQFTADDSQIAVVSKQTMVFFDTQDFRPKTIHLPDGSKWMSAVVSDHSPMVLFADSTQNVGVMDLRSQTRKTIAQSSFKNILGSVSSDGSSIAFFCKADVFSQRRIGSGLKLVATKTEKISDLMRNDIVPAIDADWVYQSPDGRFTAAKCDFSRLQPPAAGIDIWDNKTASHVARLVGASSSIIDIVPVDQGKKILACTSNGEVCIWEWTRITSNRSESEE